jgi:phospholipase/carboxylesterase
MFHSAGAEPQSLAPLGELLGSRFRKTWVVSVAAQPKGSAPGGREWFARQGLTEENQGLRVTGALPGFVAAVRRWQATTCIVAAQTYLLGFSQGAIMVLESTQTSQQLCAGAVCVAGRLVRPPRIKPRCSIKLIHGDADSVIPHQLALEAKASLASLGSEVAVDLVPFLRHQIDARVADRIVQQLQAWIV